MITKRTISKMKMIIQKKDIQITETDPGMNTVCFILPYSNSEIALTLESEDPEVQIAEFREGVNSELEEMINHLEQSKLYPSGV